MPRAAGNRGHAVLAMDEACCILEERGGPGGGVARRADRPSAVMDQHDQGVGGSAGPQPRPRHSCAEQVGGAISSGDGAGTASVGEGAAARDEESGYVAEADVKCARGGRAVRLPSAPGPPRGSFEGVSPLPAVSLALSRVSGDI